MRLIHLNSAAEQLRLAIRKGALCFFIALFAFFGLLFQTSWAALPASDSSPHIQNNATPPYTAQCPAKSENRSDDLGAKLPLWATLPFVGILLSIATFPLLTPKFWHHHYPKVAAFWALIFALPFIYFYHSKAIHEILHIYLVDYFPFIILLWVLFTITGGIGLRGKLTGTPIINVVLLFIGTIIASWVGTTGASMIMIRPVLRANAFRKKKAHIICFFIFLVANIGGALTPLGDPPLFLGFIHGVPFFWTLFNLYPDMIFASSSLLILFYFIDRYYYRRESRTEARLLENASVSIRLEGWHNVFLLMGVVGAILLSGILKLGEISFLGLNISKQNILRDFLMISMGILSLLFTKREIRQANEFTWEPIREVAYLFAGIFMTIIPALAILKAGSEGAFAFLITAIKEPHHYYWVSGALSSFLDNAPTYLVFFNSALGKLQIPESLVPGILLTNGGNNLVFLEFIHILKAISIGAVFMGATTYIGNAPNFMVKSIAEKAGVVMPSFVGYIFKYSIPILLPLFLLEDFLFF